MEEVGPAMIEDEEEEIDTSNAVVAASEVVSDQIDALASHARRVTIFLLGQVLWQFPCLHRCC